MIASEIRRNVHLFLILRRDPIDAVDCNERWRQSAGRIIREGHAL